MSEIMSSIFTQFFQILSNFVDFAWFGRVRSDSLIWFLSNLDVLFWVKFWRGEKIYRFWF